MDNYKPNSRVSKTDNIKKDIKKEKVEKIVKGAVKTKKKNSLLNMFISDDIVDLKSYVIYDVLVPTVKKAISDIVTNGVDMLLFGETGKHKRSSTSSKISYRSYYDREDRDINKHVRARKNIYTYDDITLETREEAIDVLNRLDELIDVYGIASVADLYDLVGTKGDYTDCKYGWVDLRSATYVETRKGYLLKMPRTMPLGN